MIVLYILCAALICIVGYAFVWICAGVVMSLFSKKFQIDDEADDYAN